MIETNPVPNKPICERRTPTARLAALSTMLFLQHAVLGAWSPVYPLHLHQLEFSGARIGAIYSALAVASICAPWIGGQLADRVVSAGALLAVCHALGAILLWAASLTQRFEMILLLMTLHAFLYMPTMGVSNAVVFRNLADPDREFGLVRLWGTASWIVMAWCMGYWLARPDWLPEGCRPAVVDCLKLAALVGALLAAFCLIVPPTPPVKTPGLAAFSALRMLKDPSSAVLLLVCFLLAVGMPFVYPLAGLFLNALDIPDADVAPWLSIGQVAEIAAFLLLVLAVKRLGFKTVFLLGIASWAVRFAIWSAGGPWTLIVFAISLNGFCYAFVFGLGQIVVDNRAPADARASAQSLFQVVTFGLGMGLGYILAGAAADFFKKVAPDGAFVTDYAQVYFWPAVGAGACFIIFALCFKNPSTPEAQISPPAPTQT